MVTTSESIMTIRAFAWIVAGMLALLAMVGAVWSGFATNRIVLTDASLQERVNRQLPREVKGVTIERATVTIADRQIALRVAVRASAVSRSLAATVVARGIPRFDAEFGELYFDADDVKFENFTVNPPAGVTDRPDGRPGGLAGEVLTRVKEGAAATIAAGVKAYLAARPVYRFKDDLKGLVLKAAVTDIAVEGNAVAIGLSLLNLSAMVAVCLLLLVAVLIAVVQLVRHPSWGVRGPA
jgi:hypothetical protein